jgi:anti-sigma regulatory factor (Ser/Thr protein kinase)
MLLLIIPLLFLYTGQQFLDVSSSNQDRLEKDKIGIMHDTLSSLLTATNFDVVIIEKELRHIQEQNPDIVDYKIAKQEENNIISVVAFNTHEVAVPLLDLDLYVNASLRKDESIIFEFIENDARMWSTYRHVQSESGTSYFIYTKLSLQQVDTVFKARERDAYLGLVFIYFFVIALAYWHIRLTDYRFLYVKATKTIETKDLFTNMIAHELRAPLTAIRGYASILEHNSQNAAQKEQAHRIEQSSERLLTIINDLLDVARIQSGSLKIDKKEIDITSVVASVLQELTVTAEEKSIVFVTDYISAKSVAIADQQRFHQALTNLVSNAIKYTHDGKITLSVEDTHASVEIRVKDTGMGISSSDQKKLFAPFFRVADTDVTSITGTGLGMWITKQLIELMDGTIGVESIKNVGTQIVVTLPKELKVS